MNPYMTAVVLILLVIIHEAAHAFVGIRLLGLTPTVIAIGVPIKFKAMGKTFSTYIYEYKRPGWPPIVVSWLLLGGGVGFEDEAYYAREKYWQKILMIWSGPASNFLFALLVPVLLLGVAPGWNLFAGYTYSFIRLVDLIPHGGEVLMSLDTNGFVQATMGAVEANPLVWMPVCLWVLWNVCVGAINLLPIPDLDGGQILITTLVQVFGTKITPVMKSVNEVCLYIILGVSILSVLGWVFTQVT